MVFEYESATLEFAKVKINIPEDKTEAEAVKKSFEKFLDSHGRSVIVEKEDKCFHLSLHVFVSFPLNSFNEVLNKFFDSKYKDEIKKALELATETVTAYKDHEKRLHASMERKSEAPNITAPLNPPNPANVSFGGPVVFYMPSQQLQHPNLSYLGPIHASSNGTASGPERHARTKVNRNEPISDTREPSELNARQQREIKKLTYS